MNLYLEHVGRAMSSHAVNFLLEDDIEVVYRKVQVLSDNSKTLCPLCTFDKFTATVPSKVKPPAGKSPSKHFNATFGFGHMN